MCPSGAIEGPEGSATGQLKIWSRRQSQAPGELDMPSDFSPAHLEMLKEIRESTGQRDEGEDEDKRASSPGRMRVLSRRPSLPESPSRFILRELSISHQGWLTKHSRGGFRNWNRRWFILIGGSLYYSHSVPKCEPGATHDGQLHLFAELLQAQRVEPVPNCEHTAGYHNVFRVVMAEQALLFAAPSAEARLGWMAQLEQHMGMQPVTRAVLHAELRRQTTDTNMALRIQLLQSALQVAEAQLEESGVREQRLRRALAAKDEQLWRVVQELSPGAAVAAAASVAHSVAPHVAPSPRPAVAPLPSAPRPLHRQALQQPASAPATEQSSGSSTPRPRAEETPLPSFGAEGCERGRRSLRGGLLGAWRSRHRDRPPALTSPRASKGAAAAGSGSSTEPYARSDWGGGAAEAELGRCAGAGGPSYSSPLPRRFGSASPLGARLSWLPASPKASSQRGTPACPPASPTTAAAFVAPFTSPLIAPFTSPARETARETAREAVPPHWYAAPPLGEAARCEAEHGDAWGVNGVVHIKQGAASSKGGGWYGAPSASSFSSRANTADAEVEELNVKAALPPALPHPVLPGVLMLSWLTKQSKGGFTANWNRRAFVLIGSSLFYEKNYDTLAVNPKRFAQLEPGCQVLSWAASGMPHNNVFAVRFPEENREPDLLLAADTPRDKFAWMEVLGNAVWAPPCPLDKVTTLLTQHTLGFTQRQVLQSMVEASLVIPPSNGHSGPPSPVLPRPPHRPSSPMDWLMNALPDFVKNV